MIQEFKSAIGYVRVSTEQQAGADRYGIDAQKQEILLYANDKGYNIVEWVIDEVTGHQMLVYYSLGNFVNWTSGTGNGVANRMVGGMSQVTLIKEDDQVKIESYDVEPVVCHLEEGTNGVTVYKLEEYTSELAARNQIAKQDPAFSKEYCEQLCAKVWPKM